MVMISIAVGAVAAKFFGKKRTDADEDVQGDHPIVRAMFRAINTGEDNDLRELLHPDLRLYVNDYPVVDHVRDHGPMLVLEAFNDLRLNLPDIRWELYDELSGKDEGEQKIAIRFSSQSTLDGVEVDFSIAAFGIVRDEQLIEWRQVADLETFESHREAAHRPPIRTAEPDDAATGDGST